MKMMIMLLVRVYLLGLNFGHVLELVLVDDQPRIQIINFKTKIIKQKPYLISLPWNHDNNLLDVLLVFDWLMADFVDCLSSFVKP